MYHSAVVAIGRHLMGENALEELKRVSKEGCERECGER